MTANFMSQVVLVLAALVIFPLCWVAGTLLGRRHYAMGMILLVAVFATGALAGIARLSLAGLFL